MSEGQLCGAKIEVALSKNSLEGYAHECDLYVGHGGKHSKGFYNVTINKGGWKDNHPLGRIEWDDSLKL